MVLVLAVIAAGCTGQASNQSSSNGASKKQTIVYDHNGITFDYPVNWEVISPSQLNIYVTDYTYLAVLSNNETDGTSIVRMVKVQTDKSYDDYVASERDYDKNSSGFAETNINVNGLHAIELSYTGSSLSGDKKKSLNVYFEKNNEIYYVTYSTLATDFNSEQADFNTMINSFQIK